MKRLVIISLSVAQIFFAPGSFLGGMDVPPHTTSAGVGVNENFKEIYREMDTHRHQGNDDSSRLFDVLPDSPSIYDVGSTSSPWQNIFLSSSVVFNVQFSSTTTLIDGRPRMMPSFIGQIVLSSGAYDLWVATGLGDSASWKVFRSSGTTRY